MKKEWTDGKRFAAVAVAAASWGAAAPLMVLGLFPLSTLVLLAGVVIPQIIRML